MRACVKASYWRRSGPVAKAFMHERAGFSGEGRAAALRGRVAAVRGDFGTRSDGPFTVAPAINAGSAGRG